ncbi:unnamed protein product [Effrenium voratum]|uniref:Uncharacterized protein n=1 Tax=Effrenium voratum TaxID=2562239 RepID=A0AA36IW66_9DINO|nr:unnamed protein product [Effrenium voratum]
MAEGLHEFISSLHWHWQLAECLQALDLPEHVALRANAGTREAAETLSALSDGAGAQRALLWEPNAPELRSLRRQLAPNARVVVVARPWRFHDWPVAIGKAPSQEALCKDLQDAGFEVMNVRVASYPCEISSSRWLAFLDHAQMTTSSTERRTCTSEIACC